LLSAITLLLGAQGAHGAATLYFVPSLDSQGQINVLWSTVGNWYFSLVPTPVPANRLPQAGDTVYIQLSQYKCVVDVPLVTIDTLYASANIVGGNFSIQTINSSHSTFDGATVTLQRQWNSGNDQIVNATVNIMAGALFFENGNNPDYINNSSLYDIGQIELMNGAVLIFSGTNHLTVTTNAQFTSVGTNQVQNSPGDPLTFDNNGVVQSQGGTLLIESDSVFWTNSFGVGRFQTVTSNAVIEINGPFAVQTNCTNFVTGPGVFYLYNGAEITINGRLEIGEADPTPGTLAYQAYMLDGTGQLDIVGSAGAPSTLVWDGGTFAGPVVNIDPWSQLVISNTIQKVLTHSTINNAGTTTWLVDGNTFQMDNGAVFNNLSNAVFAAQNSAVLLGGAGTNSSFFYNAGTFRKSGSTNAINFTADSSAPSVYFLNAGLLDVQSGALYLEWGTNSGQCHIALGAELHFWLGTNVQNATATFTGPGAVAINGANFWLAGDLSMDSLEMVGNGEIDGPGNLTINGAMTLGYGTVQGGGWLNLGTNASLLIATNPVTLYRSVNNAGNAVVTNSGLFAGKPLTWNNLPGSSLNIAAATLGNTIGYPGPAPIINNAGVLSNSGPSQATVQVNWAVTNSGVLVANPYNFLFSQSLFQTGGTTQINPGATLTISGPGHTFNLLGGVLEGEGTLAGVVVNAGTIHPGDSPGILTVGFGSLTNLPGAILAVDIGGTVAGAQYGQLNGTYGQLWLNNLILSLTAQNGFRPQLGDSFMVLSNASQLSGIFAAVKGNQYGGIVLVPHYTASSVTLVAESALSPAFVNGALSFTFPTLAGRTNLVQYSPILSPPNWQTVATIVGDGSTKTYNGSGSTNKTGFYKLIYE